MESGERRIVGVNAYTESEAPLEMQAPAFDELESAQKVRLEQVRARRDDSVVERCLANVGTAASADHNLVPPIIEAVRVRATIGEISGALEECWGRYQPV